MSGVYQLRGVTSKPMIRNRVVGFFFIALVRYFLWENNPHNPHFDVDQNRVKSWGKWQVMTIFVFLISNI